MPRRGRVASGGLVYHVPNRSVAGLLLFRKEADYEAFERITIESQQWHPTRVLVWCLVRNHFVVWPQEDGELTAHFRWVHTHAMRWHVAYGNGRPRATCPRGVSSVSRWKGTSTFHRVSLRRAKCIDGWCGWACAGGRWGSLWARRRGGEQWHTLLSDWPLPRPADWLNLVNQPMTEKEAEAIRTCIARNRPYGSEQWQGEQAGRLGFGHTLRREGRPRGIGARRRGKN